MAARSKRQDRPPGGPSERAEQQRACRLGPAVREASAEGAEYDPAYLTLAKQAETSDICLAGKVVDENPARWNSPDGGRPGGDGHN